MFSQKKLNFLNTWTNSKHFKNLFSEFLQKQSCDYCPVDYFLKTYNVDISSLNLIELMLLTQSYLKSSDKALGNDLQQNYQWLLYNEATMSIGLDYSTRLPIIEPDYFFFFNNLNIFTVDCVLYTDINKDVITNAQILFLIENLTEKIYFIQNDISNCSIKAFFFFVNKISSKLVKLELFFLTDQNFLLPQLENFLWEIIKKNVFFNVLVKKKITIFSLAQLVYDQFFKNTAILSNRLLIFFFSPKEIWMRGKGESFYSKSFTSNKLNLALVNFNEMLSDEIFYIIEFYTRNAISRIALSQSYVIENFFFSNPYFKINCLPY